MLTRENAAEYQRRYDLTYHVPYALEAEAEVGLQGKSVLEIGGSLPEAFVSEGLGVRQWIAIEEMSYWHEVHASGGTHGTPAPTQAVRTLASAHRDDLASSYRVLAGRVEQLPAVLHGHFDVAFSIAAFEHIDRLGQSLEAIHAALRPGGRLFAMFSPIWSAHNGHHLPAIRDRSGADFNFSRSPIPPWGHLYMRPPEMFEYLAARTDRETAADIVYYVFNSPHINRLFTEDYVDYCRGSAFEVERCGATFSEEVPPQVQDELERHHPGRKRFGNNGMLLVLRKHG